MAKQDACLFSWLGVNWETNTGKKGAVLRAYVGTKTRKGKISAEQKWHHLLLNTYWSEGNSPIFIRLTDLENSPYCSIKPRLSQILSPKEKFWPVPLCPRECQFVINCVKSLPLAVVWGPLTRSGSCWLPEVDKETPASSPTQKIVTSVKPCAAPYWTVPSLKRVWLCKKQACSVLAPNRVVLATADISWASAPSTKPLSCSHCWQGRLLHISMASLVSE